MNDEALLTLAATNALAAVARGEVTAEDYATVRRRPCEAAQQHDRQRRAGNPLGPLLQKP